MTDIEPDDYTDEGDERPAAAQEHPEQEAHGGSMAPGLVDDTGHRTAEVPPGTPDTPDGR